jgi:uncharacterized protein with PQ loop repeat
MPFLEQVQKTWRSSSAKQLSFWMLGAFALGVLLRIIYGLSIDSLLTIVTNVATLALASA